MTSAHAPAPQPGQLHTSDPSELDFRHSTSAQPFPEGGAARAVREAAVHAGIDAIADLYNEAMRHFADGHLRLARERLQMLLCMAPNDGEAWLFLAQVHAQEKHWSDALAGLEQASARGIRVSTDLFRSIQASHQQALAAAPTQQRAPDRMGGDLSALRTRNEALSRENRGLKGRVGELQAEVRKWAWLTTGITFMAFAAVGVALWFDPTDTGTPVGQASTFEAEDVEVGDAPVVPIPPPIPPVAPMTPAVPVGPIGIPIDSHALAREALAAQPEVLAGASLQMSLSRHTLTVVGEVVSYTQRKGVEALLLEVPGVRQVDWDGVTVQSEIYGTRHTVARGETLSHVAHAYYGDGTLTAPIEDANDLRPPGQVRIGQELVVPPLPSKATSP